MDKVYDKACRGSEVPLRALWCKATNGSGRLIHNPILEEFEAQGFPGIRGCSSVSKYEGEIDFETVRGYYKMRRKRKWHLMVIAGVGYLALVESLAY
jgi:hypothetical protein